MIAQRLFRNDCNSLMTLLLEWLDSLSTWQNNWFLFFNKIHWLFDKIKHKYFHFSYLPRPQMHPRMFAFWEAFLWIVFELLLNHPFGELMDVRGRRKRNSSLPTLSVLEQFLRMKVNTWVSPVLICRHFVHLSLKRVNNFDETRFANSWQGIFRTLEARS